MNQVTEAVKKMFAAFNNTQHYCLAYSGGIDSQVLLHALAQHKPPSCQFRAIHIHHGLQMAADMWVQHCTEQAQSLNVPLQIKYVDAKATKGQSPEAAARVARYAALSDEIREGEIILTAHHLNDQAETMLLQLIRGAGVKGLAAMPRQSAFYSGTLQEFPLSRETPSFLLMTNLNEVQIHQLKGRAALRSPLMKCSETGTTPLNNPPSRNAQREPLGTLYRPLLQVDRDAITAYAAAMHLSWVEDPSNENTDFDRNYLREEILPLLRQRWPSIAQTVARSAQHCAEVSDIIAEVAEQDLVIALGEKGALSIKALLSLTVARQRQVLRHWLVRQQFPVPSTTQLESLFCDVIHAAEDKMPLMQWAGVELRRFKDYLFAMLPLSPFDPSLEIEWDGRTPLVLPAELGVLSPDDPRLLSLNNPPSQNVKREPLAALQEFPLSRKTPSFLLMINLNEVQIPPESPITQGFSLKQELLPITIRFRRGGERLRVPGREGRHELKKLFQEWGVLPWRRDRVPLIYVGAELLGVLLSPDDCFHGFNG